eukprot:1181653-Amphidinium_carterae.1
MPLSLEPPKAFVDTATVAVALAYTPGQATSSTGGEAVLCQYMILMERWPRLLRCVKLKLRELRQQNATKDLCLLRLSFGSSIGQATWLPSILEVYGGLNEHSHKRWLLKKLEKKVDPGVTGGPCKFSPPIMQKMAVLTHRLVKEGVPCNLKYLSTLLCEVRKVGM